MENFVASGVGAIIEKKIHNTEYILVQERYKDDLSKETGFFEIPGGRIRSNESIYDCLRREIFEETGLNIIKVIGENKSETINVNDYRTITFSPFICEQNFGSCYPIVGIIFLCKANGKLMKQTGESRNIHWVTLKNLYYALYYESDTFYPIHIGALKTYLAYKGYTHI
jgi:ADP-ribose pyrophosphatase